MIASVPTDTAHDGAGLAAEHGGASVLLLAPVLVAALAVLAATVAVAAVLLADGRATDLADEAAIVAVHATLDGDPRACDAAARSVLVARPTASVIACRLEAGPRATVTVEVPVTAPALRRMGVHTRRATAAATVAAGARGHPQRSGARA